MLVKTCGDAGGRTKAGRPCQVAMNLGEKGLCVHHDPDRKQEALEMRRMGARASAASRTRTKVARGDVPRAPRTLSDAVSYASWAVDAVAMGELDARTAREIGNLLREFRSCLEKRSLEKEITALRTELKEAQSKRRGV